VGWDEERGWMLDNLDSFEDDNKGQMPRIIVLKHFLYMFPEEALGMPPRRGVEFSFDLMLGEVSTTPYRKTSIELVKLKR